MCAIETSRLRNLLLVIFACSSGTNVWAGSCDDDFISIGNAGPGLSVCALGEESNIAYYNYVSYSVAINGSIRSVKVEESKPLGAESTALYVIESGRYDEYLRERHGCGYAIVLFECSQNSEGVRRRDSVAP